MQGQTADYNYDALLLPGGLFACLSEQKLAKAECGDVETAYDTHDLFASSLGPSTF